MTEWLFRSHLVVSAADVEKARSVAVMVAPGGEPERNSFTVALSADGSAPATHYAADTPITIDMLRRMLPTLELGILPSIVFYRLRDDVLVDTNSPNRNEMLGQSWSFASTLADMGLQRITPTIGPGTE